MKKSILMAVLALASLGANATVVNFDGYYNDIYGDEVTGNGLQVIQTQAYNFSSSGDHFHFIRAGDYGGPSNGTSSLLEDRMYQITMTKADGGAFDLLSLLGGVFGGGAGSLSITGYSGTGSVSATLDINSSAMSSANFSNFTGLTSVVFGSTNTPGFTIDDIDVRDAVASDVPEPASLSLLGLGLAGLMLGRRKSKA